MRRSVLEILRERMLSAESGWGMLSTGSVRGADQQPRFADTLSHPWALGVAHPWAPTVQQSG
ncbi:MAG: hypothetical protein KBT84_02950, partial [Pseudomonas sp.]|nr:hypothetical protein [Pseudomonas sp.]